MRKLLSAAVVLITVGLAGCGYNDIQRGDEQVKAAWSEVLNQYQRRNDLIPNLVNTVKGFAAQEQQVLIQVTEARSRVGSIQATPELLNDEAAFRRFQQAQAGMTSALSRLLLVAENYPQLKSDANFRDLQAQLEGTENRIAVARNRYIKAVQEYNVLIRQFPVVLGDDEDDAVVDARAADFPGVGDADRVLLDGLRLGRREHQHRDLAAFAALEIAQARIEIPKLGCRERPGKVGDVCLERRHHDLRASGNEPREENAGRDEAEPAPWHEGITAWPARRACRNRPSAVSRWLFRLRR